MDSTLERTDKVVMNKHYLWQVVIKYKYVVILVIFLGICTIVTAVLLNGRVDKKGGGDIAGQPKPIAISLVTTPTVTASKVSGEILLLSPSTEDTSTYKEFVSTDDIPYTIKMPKSYSINNTPHEGCGISFGSPDNTVSFQVCTFGAENFANYIKGISPTYTNSYETIEKSGNVLLGRYGHYDAYQFIVSSKERGKTETLAISVYINYPYDTEKVQAGTDYQYVVVMGSVNKNDIERNTKQLYSILNTLRIEPASTLIKTSSLTKKTEVDRIVHYDGTITVSGRYVEYNPKAEVMNPGGLCFYVNSATQYLIPNFWHAKESERNEWFCFNNDTFALSQFGIDESKIFTDKSETCLAGNATVTITNYTVPNIEGAVVDGADLVRIVSKTPYFFGPNVCE